MAAKRTTKSESVSAQPEASDTPEAVTEAPAEATKVEGTPRRRRRKGKKRGAIPSGSQDANKAAYVRANPKLSATDLVAKAAAEGISMGTNYVSRVRSTDRANVKRKKGKAAKPSAHATVSPVATPMKRGPGRPRKNVTALVHVPAEPEVPRAKILHGIPASVAPTPTTPANHFRALIAELGLTHATELLETERERVRALLRS